MKLSNNTSEAWSEFKAIWIPLINKYGAQYIEELSVSGRNTSVAFGIAPYRYTMMKLANGDFVADTLD